MILCFLLSMHKYKPFLLDIQTGLLWVRKRQFVSPNTLHDLKLYWPLAVAVIHKLFLVEIELRMVNRPKPHKKKQCFWDYLDLGMFRLVWKTVFFRFFGILIP